MLRKVTIILIRFTQTWVCTVLILGLAIAPSLPMFKFLLASSMVFHMLIQLPLLVVAGYFLSKQLKVHVANQPLNFYLSSWLWILVAGMFWMLPISLDKALLHPQWDTFKVLTLLISGALLRGTLVGPKILSLFFIGSTVMMLFFIGYFYQDSELRLCNSYLLESQKIAGIGLIMMAFALLFLSIYAVRSTIFSESSTN